MEYRYVKLANEIERKISEGIYSVGEKLPSLRQVKRERGVSLSTVYQAYMELEDRGLVEAREKSGYFVRIPASGLLPLPSSGQAAPRPLKVTVNTLAGLLQENIENPDLLPLGTAVPAPEFLPVKQLARIGRERGGSYLFATGGTGYGSPRGQAELLRQIERRTAMLYDGAAGDETIITAGCMHGVGLCLRAVANPGDIILVESPTFLCYLQLIEDLNMRVIEVPSHPGRGMEAGMIRQCMEDYSVRAAILNSNFPNPLGYGTSAEKKREIVALFRENNVPLIEDDIYGDLYFGHARPSTFKQFDRQGLVLYCSSFSKSLLPDLRVGWVMPGRFSEKVKRLKFNSLIATSKLNQLIVADFLASGAYERHLRRMRNLLQKQVGNMTRAIARHFPENTRISSPEGGLCLWVELDRSVDSLDLFHRAAAGNISLLPGAVCSGTGQYRHCIRLNCGVPWSRTVEQGIATLGTMVRELSSQSPGKATKQTAPARDPDRLP